MKIYYSINFFITDNILFNLKCEKSFTILKYLIKKTVVYKQTSQNIYRKR